MARLSKHGTAQDLPVLVELIRTFPNGMNLAHPLLHEFSPFYISMVKNMANPEIALTMWRLGADVQAQTLDGPIIFGPAHDKAFLPILEDCLKNGGDANAHMKYSEENTFGFACKHYNVPAVKLLLKHCNYNSLTIGLRGWAWGYSLTKFDDVPKDLDSIEEVFEILCSTSIIFKDVLKRRIGGLEVWAGVLSKEPIRFKTELLLKSGADINAKFEADSIGRTYTPILSCRCKSDLEFLISRGADPYFVSDDGYSLLHKIAQIGPISKDVLEKIGSNSIPKFATEHLEKFPEDCISEYLKTDERNLIIEQIKFLER